MGSAKDVAIRTFHFIGGFILTIAGIFLIIFEFSGSKGSDLSFVPYIILFFGIGWLRIAFNKHKKAQQQVQSSSPLISTENEPPTIQTENKPPPMN